MRKTKIVATIGPTSNTTEAITELGDKGVNVARMNMSHGDHASHEDVINKIKAYNARGRGCIAVLLDTKARAPRARSAPRPRSLDITREFVHCARRMLVPPRDACAGPAGAANRIKACG